MPKAVKQSQLFSSIKSLIQEAQKSIVRNVNMTMLITYFQIGRMIVEEEQDGKHRAEYADQTLKQLSKDLTREFGRGYSYTNLEYIRKFYVIYQNRISQSVIEEFNSKSTSDMLSPGNTTSRPVPSVSANSIFTPPQFRSTFALSWTHYVQLIKISNKTNATFTK